MWFYFSGHCDPIILVRSFWSYRRHSYLSYISYIQDGYLILFLFVISHPRISLIRFIYHGLKFTTPGSLIGLIQDLKLMEKVFYVLSLRSEFWSSFSMVSLFHRDCLAPSIQHRWLLARVQRDARMQPPSGNFKRPLNQFKICYPLLVEDRWSSCCVTSLEDCWLTPGCKANLIQPSLMRKSCGWRKGIRMCIQIQLIDQFEETWQPWELMERSSKW